VEVKEMLRFFVFDEPFTLKLLLEGELDRTAISQYETAISTAKAERGDRKLLVDVKDLTLVDPAAEQTLLGMRLSEMHFVAAEGRIAELLRQQEHRKCQQQPSFTDRIKCFFAELFEAFARPMVVSRGLNRN
jgi:hypothetical protein